VRISTMFGLAVRYPTMGSLGTVTNSRRQSLRVMRTPVELEHAETNSAHPIRAVKARTIAFGW
jgi:hypothetical protein